MFSYDDQTETSITVCGVRYETRPEPEGISKCCLGCVFSREEFRLLVSDFCSNIPCTHFERAHDDNVIFVEVSNGDT